MRSKIKVYNFREYMLWLFLFFSLVLPKAGIKLGGIPITVSSVMLLVMLCLLLLDWLGGNGVKKENTAVLLLIGVSFWLVRIGAVKLISPTHGLGEVLGYIIPLCVYPLAYFVIVRYASQRNIDEIFGFIRVAVGILFAYTFLQVLFGIGGVDIPGITVNWSDYTAAPEDWWLDKCNDIGSGSKFFSTYQNGNIFGCAVLMLFPVAFRMNYRYNWERLVFLALYYAICFLTGSRTVMIGAIVYTFILGIHWLRKCKLKSSYIVIISIGIIGLTAILLFMPYMFSSLNLKALINRVIGSLDLDTFLSGAGRTATAVEYFTWAIKHPLAVIIGGYGAEYSGGAYEMTYVAVFMLGGLIGLALFIAPIVSAYFKCRRAYSVSRDTRLLGITEGVATYCIAAFIEGAYWLPPTAMNLWILLGLGRVVIKGLHIYGERI